MNRIDESIKSGTYTFSTESGSVYTIQIDKDTKFLIRNNTEFALRKDAQKIIVKEIKVIEVGAPAILVLEPLGRGNVTIRNTSSVKTIHDIRDCH